MSVPHVQCDWSMSGTRQKLEADIGITILNGTGFYLTSTDTMLVVPNVVTDKPWRRSWSKEAEFTIYVWNVPFSQTIFATAAVIPVRLDSRD